MEKSSSEIVSVGADLLNKDDKTVRLAATMLLYNYSISLLDRQGDDEVKVQIIAGFGESLAKEDAPMNFFRACATVGNLIFDNEENRGLAKELGLGEVARASIQKLSGDEAYPKFKDILEELLKMF